MHAILTYHSLDDSGSPISLAPEAFERHVAFLSRPEVDVLPLGELLAAEEDGRSRVALTFDDGFQNFAERAWPRLREHGLPAIVYVVSAHAGRTNRWGGRSVPGIPELPLMDWDTLGGLHEQGLELGIHGRDHAALEGRSRAFVEEEIEEARSAIFARTGARARHFAYPYGAFDGTALDVARERTESAVTTRLHWLPRGADRHLLPRLDAYYLARPGRLDALGSAGFRRFVRFRHALRSVRSVLRRSGGASRGDSGGGTW